MSTDPSKRGAHESDKKTDMDQLVAFVADWKGIAGEAIALQLAMQGFTVVVNAPQDRIDPLLPENLPGRVLGLPFTTHSEQDYETVISQVIDLFGGLQVLVNNFNHWNDAPLDNITESMWQEVLENNVVRSFRLSRVASKLMLALGGGKIVQVTSTSCFTGHHTQYAASCAAIHSMTKSLARELAPSITVNTIAVGTLEEPWIDEGGAELRDILTKDILLKRLCHPQEVADLVAILIQSIHFMTGQMLVLDGGETLW